MGGQRRPRRQSTLILAVGVLIAAAACGEDDPPAAGSADAGPSATGMPAGSAVPDALPGSPPEVAEALLTPDDLGEGWIDLGPLPFEERAFTECPESAVVTGSEDPARLGEAQSYYAEDDPAVVTFGESVSLWESPDVARDRLATFGTLPEVCRPFDQEVPDGRTATVTLTERAAPPLGDEAVAQSVEFALPGEPAIVRDVVLVRIGDALVLTQGPDAAEGDPTADSQRERFLEHTAAAVDKARRVLGG